MQLLNVEATEREMTSARSRNDSKAAEECAAANERSSETFGKQETEERVESQACEYRHPWNGQGTLA